MIMDDMMMYMMSLMLILFVLCIRYSSLILASRPDCAARVHGVTLQCLQQ